MKQLFILLSAIALSTTLFAQAPEKMSYQAVIRDANNTLVTSQPVGMQISILQGSANGVPVYVETQNPTSNLNGLVSLEIGSGTVVSGTFGTIDWTNGPFFIQTETDPTGGSNYSITGTSQLLSVPYALYAKKADSANHVNITGNEPAFWGWDKDVSDDFDGQYSNLTGAPTNVSAFNNDAGYLTTFTEVDGSITNELQVLSISNDTVLLTDGGFAVLPAGFDGQYSNLTGAPTNVSAFNNDAGYLTTFTEVDGSITNELQVLSISNDTVLLTDGGFAVLPAGFDGQYSNLTGAPTNVSAFNNDAGYLTTFTEVDGSVTDELQVLSISNDTVLLTDGGFAVLPAGFDGQYSNLTGAPTNVSAFNNDAGYLTSEIDSSITNEIQNLASVLNEGNDANADSILNLAQLTIGASVPTADAALDINVTNGAFLLPRLNTSQRNNLSAVEGMVIFNTQEHKFQGYRAAKTIDQQQDSASHFNGFLGPGLRQSFTAGITGNMTAIFLGAVGGSPATVSIFHGDSITGIPFQTQSIGINPGHHIYCLPQPVPLIAGQTYSIKIDGAFQAYFLDVDRYSGGHAFSTSNQPQPNFDFQFKTYMDDTGWVDFH